MNNDKIWLMVLSEIELAVSRPTFAAFFSKTKLVSIENNQAIVSVSNPLVKQILESRYIPTIRELIKKHSQIDTTVKLVVSDDTIKIEPSGPLFNRKPESILSSLVEKYHLNPLYTFENFAVSSTNQMAYAAAQSIANSPGKTYNPLFLYGGVGVGKTHLMQAVATELLCRNETTKVIFCSGEEFTNEIIDAIRLKNTHRFKDKFRSAQLLMIDDIQFIAGKNAVQEEFFYTFNAIHKRGAQIILTSDRPPSEISKLEDRLRSRFEGGLLIDIQQPDFELRTAIILIKARLRGINLSMNVAQELANQISDGRRLEGTLVRLVSESTVRKEPITVELVSRLFGKSLSKNNLKSQTYSFSPQSVMNAVSRYYGVKLSLIKSETRAKPISLPRQVLMYLLRTEMSLSLNDIGAILGGRDHTTIMHGVAKINELIKNSGKIKNDLLQIKKTIEPIV
ncbi:chromosomal replication initiator protein DnaA [Candidatus Gottesmanbacteria bacterium]|nr:chromosomal replication initiator protein DnaA [Candidatus Gottesmanbacteria bacterium]